MSENHVFNTVEEGKVADIGAGTGKLTENLVSIGLGGFAVEPNDAMRAEASKNMCVCGGGLIGLKAVRKQQGLKITV